MDFAFTRFVDVLFEIIFLSKNNKSKLNSYDYNKLLLTKNSVSILLTLTALFKKSSLRNLI